MEKKTPIKESQQILELASRALPDSPATEMQENSTEPDLFELLRKRLSHLLDHDMPGLLQAMYRMDVEEKRVREILSITQPDNMATELAMLVWARAKKKLETRKKYS